MKVLDTTFLVDVLRGNSKTSKILENKDLLLTTQINIYELIRGLFLRQVAPEKMKEVMVVLGDLRVLPLNDDALISSADISAELMRTGKLLPDADCLIAGTTKAHGIKTIISNNRKHFERIEGLTVENY